MDIRGKSAYPSGALSNFAPHSFVFDGVNCSSMEGLVQAFKFDDPALQVEICNLVGSEAKRRGTERNNEWMLVQTLWWKGQAYNRHGVEYQQLLDRAFDALAQNEDFCKALLATGSEELTHVIGNPDPRDTVLTEREFCDRLTKIRSRLQSEEDEADYIWPGPGSV